MELPKELLTFLLAFLPLTELRATIPLALTVYHLPIWSAFFWSVLGNSLATLLVLWFLPILVNFFAVRFVWLKKFLDWLFERTRNKAIKPYLKYGQWALVIFVAIPLPGTGGWTGALIAYLFDIPFWRAFFLINLGIVLAGLIVTITTLGIVSFVNIF